jgi:hypothetical protein
MIKAILPTTSLDSEITRNKSTSHFLKNGFTSGFKNFIRSLIRGGTHKEDLS